MESVTELAIVMAVFAVVSAGMIVDVYRRLLKQIENLKVDLSATNLSLKETRKNVVFLQKEAAECKESERKLFNSHISLEKAVRVRISRLEDNQLKDINILAKRITVLKNAAAGYQVVNKRLSKLEERNKPKAWVPVNWFK